MQANGTKSEADMQGRLKLHGSCCGCRTKLRLPGSVAITQDSMPTGSAGWVCGECADRLPVSRTMQRRVDAALKIAPRLGYVYAEAWPAEGAALRMTPILAAAVDSARGAARA